MNDRVCDSLERHFDTAFAAPDGIKKLRELILTLAMQGKLVEQDPNDPPASQLLKEIEAEKKRLVKEGKIRGTRSREDAKKVKIEDVPYALPQNWQWVRFGDIAQHNSGKTLDKGRNTGLPRDYITTSNLYWGRFELGSVRQMLIRQEELEKCTAKKNDLLICEGGEAGRAAVWNYDSEVCFQNHVHRARFYGNVDPYFAFRFFERLNAAGEINQHRKGVGISNMSSAALASIMFPLPPLPEQHRIVAKIDQLMVRCDELKKLRDEREQKRRSVHTAAIKQLLDTPTSSFPRRRESSCLEALDSRRSLPSNGVIGGGNDGSFADAWQFITLHFGELYAVRENVTELRKAILQLGVQGKLVAHNGQSSDWKIRLLKELTTKIGSGSTPSGGKESYQEAGVPLIRSMNIHFGGFVHKGLVFLSEAQADKLKNVSVRTDDVLLNITGASIGRVATVPEKMEGARVNQHVCIIRPTLEIIPRFLEAFLASPIVQNMIDDVQVGATREALTKSMIERFEILLPPVNVQQQIVAKIDQLMTLCNTLEQQIDAASRKQTKLLDAVMAQL